MKTITISMLAAMLATLSACGQEPAANEQAPAVVEELPEANDEAILNDAAPPPEETPPAAGPVKPKPKIKIAPEPKLETPKPPPVNDDPHAGHDMSNMANQQ